MKPRISTGSSTDLRFKSTSLSSGVNPPAGTQPSWTAKTMINSSPSQKSGIEIPSRENEEAT